MSEKKKNNKMSALIGSLTQKVSPEVEESEARVIIQTSKNEARQKKSILSASIRKDLFEKAKALSIKYSISTSAIIEDALTLYLDEFEQEYGVIEVGKIKKNNLPKIKGKPSEK